MKRFLQAAVVSCSLPLIQAGGGFKWNGHRARDGEEYVPAYETAMALNIQASAMGPAPTSPPQLMKGRFRSLGERQDANDQPGSVCGYIEGSSGTAHRLLRVERSFSSFSELCADQGASIPIRLRSDRLVLVHHSQRHVGCRLLSLDVPGLLRRHDLR